jgi:hypothetical protein
MGCICHDPETKQIHLSRDIVWLNKMFFDDSHSWVTIKNENGTEIETVKKEQLDN